MFSAKVFRVLVGSLSGTMEEVYVAKEVIRKWNLENAERTGKLFLPIEWSVKVNPDEVDVVIGIVGNWIENTAFIDDCIKAGKQVMLFFNVYHDPKNTIPTERDSVLAFHNQINNRCYCTEFKGNPELCFQLSETLKTIE